MLGCMVLFGGCDSTCSCTALQPVEARAANIVLLLAMAPSLLCVATSLALVKLQVSACRCSTAMLVHGAHQVGNHGPGCVFWYYWLCVSTPCRGYFMLLSSSTFAMF